MPVAQVDVPAHQPQTQLASLVHASQAVLVAQSSVVPPQLPAYQTQSAQVPVSGPDPVPVEHWLVLAHHPQTRLGSLAQSVQPVLTAHGSVLDDLQAPPSQVSPAQQSSVTTQLSFPTRQAHFPVPESHIIQPQQSRLDRQTAPDSAQHARFVGLARQLRSWQHWPAAVHVSPAGLQDEGVLHALLWHVSPARQGSPPVQQGWSRSPQVAASQVLFEHAPPFGQALPHVPQFFGSVLVSTHEWLQQVPALQTLFVQQAWPMAPQAVGVSHLLFWHVRPALHGVAPVQHGWWAAPQAGAVSHTPPVQTRPEAHVLPGEQHGWRAPPQVAGSEHTFWSHTSPALQAVPLQQGWPAEPQDGDRVQVPFWQTRSALQAVPLQQGCVSRPQADWEVQVPVTQVSPELQVVPLQQGCRSAPHWLEWSGVASRWGITTSYW